MPSDAHISRFMSLLPRIDAKAMAAHGHPFFISENGVWLTESVPPAFLSRIDSEVEA